MYASFVGLSCCELVKGVMHLSDYVYAASLTTEESRGKVSKAAGNPVCSMAAWSNDFPGAATAKNELARGISNITKSVLVN